MTTDEISAAVQALAAARQARRAFCKENANLIDRLRELCMVEARELEKMLSCMDSPHGSRAAHEVQTLRAVSVVLAPEAEPKPKAKAKGSKP